MRHRPTSPRRARRPPARAQDVDCGPAGDGCGSVAPVRRLPGGRRPAAAAATPSVCGAPSCTPQTCATLRASSCGPAGDGCGGLLQCGTCPAGQTCGGGGMPGCAAADVHAADLPGGRRAGRSATAAAGWSSAAPARCRRRAAAAGWRACAGCSRGRDAGEERSYPARQTTPTMTRDHPTPEAAAAASKRAMAWAVASRSSAATTRKVPL